MADTVTLARPYAQAIFKRAQEQADYDTWSRLLAVAREVASDERVQALLADPNVTEEQQVQLFADVCGDQLTDEGRNLLRLLAANDRLAVLPDIAALYEEARAEAENVVEAEVASAFPLTDEQQQKLTQALERRLGCKVKLSVITDESLVGGVIIRAGDQVIDSSVRGKLASLAGALSH